MYSFIKLKTQGESMFGSSKALQRQIMERDAQIAEITKELETYKMLVGLFIKMMLPQK